MLRFTKPITDTQKAYFASYGYLLPWFLLGAALFTVVDSGLSGTNLSLYFHSKVTLVMPTDGIAWAVAYFFGYVLSFVLGFLMSATALVGFINIQKNFDDDETNDTEPVLNWLTIGLAVGLGGFMVWNSVQSSVYISETKGYQGTEFSSSGVDAANTTAVSAANAQYDKDLAALDDVYSKREAASKAATANAVKGWKSKAVGSGAKWANAQSENAENRGLSALGAMAAEKEKKAAALQNTRNTAVNTAENRYKQGVAKLDGKQKADDEKVKNSKASIKTSLMYISCFTVPSIFFFYFVIARIMVFSGMRIIFEMPKNLSDGSGWAKIWAALSYFVGVLLGNTAHKIRAAAPVDLGALDLGGSVNTAAVNTGSGGLSLEDMFLKIEERLEADKSEQKQQMEALKLSFKANSGAAPTPTLSVNTVPINTVNKPQNVVNTAQMPENGQNTVNTAKIGDSRVGADLDVYFTGVDFAIDYKDTADDLVIIDKSDYSPKQSDLKNRFTKANGTLLNPQYSRAAPNYDGSRGAPTAQNKVVYDDAMNDRNDALVQLYELGLTIKKINRVFEIVEL